MGAWVLSCVLLSHSSPLPFMPCYTCWPYVPALCSTDKGPVRSIILIRTALACLVQVRWQAMVGLPGESWVDEVGIPGMVQCTLAEAVPQLVLLPWLLRVSQQISTCHSQYHWSMFWTRHFQSLKATDSSMSVSESFMWSGSTCLSQWWSM